VGTVADTITIPTPVVPYGPKGVDPRLATADYLGSVLDYVQATDEDHRRRIHIGGSNVTATVEQLLRDVARALRVEPVVGDGLVDIDAIDARARAATRGPWTIKRSENSIVRDSEGLPVYQDIWVADVDVDHENAAFIAASRVDVPALVAEVRRLRREIADLDLTRADVEAVSSLAVDSVDTGPHSARDITLAEALGQQAADAVAQEALGVVIARLRSITGGAS